MGPGGHQLLPGCAKPAPQTPDQILRPTGRLYPINVFDKNDFYRILELELEN